MTNSCKIRGNSCSSTQWLRQLAAIRRIHRTDGIYELRTEYGGNIYRVFFIFDDGQIVVLFNGFQKKTQKTPTNEIEKAIKIKEAYYADKQS